MAYRFAEFPAMGWRSRGYFPHLDGDGLIQHVVIHLADSLPKDVVARLSRLASASAARDRESKLRERVDEWLDAGRGSCVMREPDVAKLVEDTLLSFHGDRYRLTAWVVMPNHVHVLLKTHRDWALSKIVSSWKSYSGRRISERMKTNHATAVDEESDVGFQSEPEATLERGVPMRKEWIWHREYWDRYMRDDEQLQRTVRYIHENPVKAGLAKKAEDWRWSSAFPANAELLMNSNRFNTDARLEPGVPKQRKQPPRGGSGCFLF